MPTSVELVAALSSQDANERNDAAIALMDLGSPVAIAPLISAIENPANRSARGTLIYALSAFDCSDRFYQLFGWALQGGYEASWETIDLMHSQKLKPMPDDLKRCRVLLHSAYQQSQDEEVLEALGEILDAYDR